MYDFYEKYQFNFKIAKGYQIRYASIGSDITLFRNNFTVGQIASFQSMFATSNITNATSPKPAGSIEEMMITLDDAEIENTYAIGLVAYDNTMQSKISNFVYAIFQYVFQPFAFQVRVDHHHRGIIIITWKTACSNCTTGIGE